MFRKLLNAGLLVAIFFSVASLSAADGKPTAAAAPSETDDLAVRQSRIADKYARLEELLGRMAAFEGTTNPKRAALLKQALAQSKDKLTHSQLAAVARFLSQNSLDKAMTGQTIADKDLKSLLELLQSENRSDRLKNEQARIREYIKEVERLLRLEKGLQGQTEGGADAKQLSEEQQKVAERTGELAKRIQENEEGGVKPDEGSQEKKDDDTSDDKSEGKKDGSKENGDKPQNDPKDSKDNSKNDKNQPMPGSEKKDGSEQKPGNKPNGEEKPSPDSKDPKNNKEGQKPNDKPDNKDPKETKDPKDSKDPKETKQPNGEQKPEQKPDEQSPANDPKNDKPKDGQPATDQPSKQGKPSESKSDDGQKSPQQQQPENPARKRIQAAEERMKEAERKLSEAKRKEAIEEQQQAQEELEKAKAALEEILRQMREEEVERTLALLEGRFRKMLEMQLKVYESTKRLDKIPVAKRGDEVVILSGRLASDERKIQFEANKALNLLLEEGSSVALPATVEQSRDDMEQVAERLDRTEVGTFTQNLEEEIIASLEEVIEALQKAQQDNEKKKQQQQQQQQQQGEQEEPLVDKIAELKMIRALQLRVNGRTKRYANLLADADDPTGQAADADLFQALQKLAEREQSIQKITRDVVLGKNK